MELPDFKTTPAAGDLPSAESAEAGSTWTTLIGQIGRDVAEPLTAALDRVVQLTDSGRIDRRSLAALRLEIERARRAAMVGQQIARLAGGKLRQSRESLALAQVVRDVLSLRQRELQARELVVRPIVSAVDVQADPALLFAMLDAALDWAMTRARDAIELRVDRKLWPDVPRLRLRFAPRTQAPGEPGYASGLTADLDGCLVELAAQAMEVRASLGQEGRDTVLNLEFPPQSGDLVDGMSVTEFERGFASSDFLRPVAGSHVLVVASRRAVRAEVRDAVASMGLVVDFVASIEEAETFCQHAMPQALVVESVLRGDRFDRLRARLLGRGQPVAFLELMEEGAAFEISGFSGSAIAKVGRDAIAEALPQALAYELTHTL